MVRSRLDPSVNYTELKSIDPSDSKEMNYKAPLYEATVMGINTIISIGQIKNIFIDKNIVYYPIYLIKNDKVISQIGVYEIFEQNVASMLDDEGDINLEKTPPPLIYSFVTKTLIQKAVFISENPSALSASVKARAKTALPKVAAAAAAAEEDEDTETDDEDIQAAIHASLAAPKDVSRGPVKIPKRLPVQTMDQFDAELRNYRERPDQPWIQKYYMNNEFNIVKSPVDSDSFFYAISDAIRSVYPDRDINAINLREKLAGVISTEQYSAYKSLYDSFNLQLQRNRQRNEEIVAENQDLKTRLTGSQSLSEKKQIRERALVLKAENEELKEKREAIKDNMKYVQFMKGVHNIEQLRDVIRVGEGAGEFYADEFAISALEIILNIKLIIFSKTDFHDNNDKVFAMTNVIHCGKNVSKSQKEFIVQETERLKSGKHKSAAMVGLDEPKSKAMEGISKRDKYEFVPDHYIMLSQTDKHYDLITYRDTKMFTFAEIPYSVKLQVTSRCLQGFELSGIYTNIPQFMLFMKEDMESTNKHLMKEIESELADLDKSSNPHYNDSLRLMHHAMSSNKMPGFAQGDVVSPSDMKGFMNLMGGGGNNEKGGKNNWRRKISNEWCQPFTLDGHRWLSVEHYYQGNKFLKTSPEFYLLFTMDANKKSKHYNDTSILSQISSDVDLATVAGKKNPTTTIDGKKVSLRPSTVAIDPDFFNGRHSRVLEEGTMAKFSQNDDLANILLMTNNAKLINYNHTKHPNPSMHIMHVRSKLRTKNGKINDYEAIH